jgi:hypothetical protein
VILGSTLEFRKFNFSSLKIYEIAMSPPNKKELRENCSIQEILLIVGFEKK